jgi:transcriptional regulator with XRE-family HTH domain
MNLTEQAIKRRKRKGISQAEVARRTGAHRSLNPLSMSGLPGLPVEKAPETKMQAKVLIPYQCRGSRDGKHLQVEK